jgi:hypothetical protein
MKTLSWVFVALIVAGGAWLGWSLVTDGASLAQIANKNYTDEQYEAMRYGEKFLRRKLPEGVKFGSEFMDESTARRQPDGSYVVTGFYSQPNGPRTPYSLRLRRIDGGWKLETDDAG